MFWTGCSMRIIHRAFLVLAWSFFVAPVFSGSGKRRHRGHTPSSGPRSVPKGKSKDEYRIQVATQPPATLAPVSKSTVEPFSTEPPATKIPATETPATASLATESPTTDPPATKPQPTEPPATVPPATESPATVPPVTEAPATTVVSVIFGQEDLSTLAKAVIAADFVDGIGNTGTGPFTLFGPTNDAFDVLDQDLLVDFLENPEWVAHLRTLLLYHVSSGSAVLSTDIPEEAIEVPTLLVDPLDGLTENVSVTSVGGEVFVRGESFAHSQVVEADLVTDNGVVHKVDTVFLPPALTKNLLEAAQEIPGFGQVSGMIALAGVEKILTSGLVTIFAPGEKAVTGLDPTFISEIAFDSNRLAETLKNHLIEGLWPSPKLTDGLVLTSLANYPLTISVDDDYGTRVNDAVVQIFDGVAKNGIAHAIDSLLLPAPADDAIEIPGPPATEAPAPAATVAPGPITAFSVIAGEDDLVSFKNAILASDLDVLLRSSGPFTVFGPTDDAFAAADQELLSKLLQPEWRAHLNALLMFHILFGNRFLVTDIPLAGISDPTMIVPSENILLTGMGDGVYVSGESFMDSMVVEADLLASNGVVHKVGGLFMPKALTLNLLEMAQGMENFGRISALFALAGLEETLETKIITIFAPNDLAFAKLPAEVTFSVDNDRMIQILENHLVDGAYPMVKLIDGAILTTTAGFSLTVSVQTGLLAETKINGAVVELFDIVASNGLAHSIDTVLFPPDGPFAQAGPSSVHSVISSEENLSFLEQAVFAANLDNVLRGPIPFTLFGPTDDAFAAADQDLLSRLLQPEWISHLRALLMFHVSYGNRVLVSDIPPEGRTLPTLLVPPEDITAVSTSDGGVVVSGESFIDSHVVETEILAGNGVVHKVSRLFMPTALTMSLFDWADGLDSLGRVSRLITLTGLEDIFRNGIVTVFIADDEAFDKIPLDLIVQILMDRSIMERILKNHLVDGLHPRVKLIDGTEMITLAGLSLTVSVSGERYTETKINDAAVKVFDMVASNGLRHQLDRVLLPADL